ncbi:Intermediate conductance calcium-activated potassium channel protein 4 [Phytophthora nicotianae]|uniref:Intermediate conductance calcium-activated potassium channel protein 4 n=1 Tax=Phytophthora nicotianae TaxID=4792 RepID=A0A0W8DZ93_PHYNI|nr:Intermediate conductance calcium-activated potassium channel protein 4 [Phytophthora nicotianae]
MLILAVVGIVCASVEGEMLGVELMQLVEEGQGFSSSLSYSTVFIALKGVLSGTSGLLLYALVMRYRIVCKSKILAKQLPPDATFFSACSGLRSADRKIWRWGEYDVLCLDQLDVLVFTRIYLLGRVLRNQLGLNSASHEARLIGSIHQMDLSSIWLNVKFSFQKFPFESSLILLTIDWLLTSVALNFFERPSNPTETNASDAFWLTIVTITGVGYGDTFPWTLGGKIVIAIGGIIGGMVIACLLRVILIDTLQLSPQEQTVLDVARFYRYIRQRKESAAVLIQSGWKYYRAKNVSTSSGRGNEKIHLYAASEAFRLLRFAQPPSLAGDTYSNSMSSLSGASVADFVTKRADWLRESIGDRRTRSYNELERTKDLFRSIAASS